MENMNSPINILLDISKAFDMLNQEILISKHEHYRLHDLSIELFKSYFSNRKQCLEIDESDSDMLCLTIGVQQGSILGHLLFIIYINDIAHASKMFDFIIYADDTTLFTTSEEVFRNTTDQTTCEVLNKELSNINDWLKVNKLSLNLKRIKDMIFHTQKKNVPILNLKIDNVVIK